MEFDDGVLSYDEFGEMLDEITSELPHELFEHLNGGVNLLRNVHTHPEGINNNLFILGQYHCSGGMGRYINIYYGSFMRLYGRSGQQYIKKQLESVLRHELLHHLESLAGERDLEVKDAIDLAKYKARYNK